MTYCDVRTFKKVLRVESTGFTVWLSKLCRNRTVLRLRQGERHGTEQLREARAALA